MSMSDVWDTYYTLMGNKINIMVTKFFIGNKVTGTDTVYCPHSIIEINGKFQLDASKNIIFSHLSL